MYEKIKNLPKHPIVHQARDIRVIGFAVFGVLVLLVTWSGVNVIQTNYDLQKQVSKIEQQKQVQELENANLKLKNQYYNTDEYLELTARRQFGKAAPGEKLLIVPDKVALAYTANLDSDKKGNSSSVEKPFYQRNFEAWMNFFLHRGSSE